MKDSWCIYLGSILLMIIWGCSPVSKPPASANRLPVLHLQLGQQAMSTIRQKRRAALAMGMLESSKDDFVACTITYNDTKLAAETRLKGDWLDHLEGDQWSWRVKLKAGAMMGFRQFSLQHPSTRSNLMEWMFHQLLAREGLLTPKYTFVQLWLNGKYVGVYAFEEHFTADMLAHQQLPESVIMKYDETGFWQSQQYLLRYGKNVTPNLPVFQAADIDCFQTKRTLANPRLRTLLSGATRQMDKLRSTQDTLPSAKVIDFNYWAKFFALVDVTEAYHALRWHNMRFYYHPLTGQLFPIGFDGYGDNGVYRWFRKPFLGYVPEEYPNAYFAEEYLSYKCFNDPQFRQYYENYLRKFSSEAYLTEAWTALAPQIDNYNDILGDAEGVVPYTIEPLRQRAATLRQALASYDFDKPAFKFIIHEPLYETCATEVPLGAVALKAFPTQDSNALVLQNYFCRPISIMATGPKRSKPLHELAKEVVLPAFEMSTTPPPTVWIPWPKRDRYVFYQIEGRDYWFKQPIAVGSLPSTEVDSYPIPYDTTVFQPTEGRLVVHPGHHTIHGLQVLPATQKVEILPGVTIDLLEEAAIIINGDLVAHGTVDQCR